MPLLEPLQEEEDFITRIARSVHSGSDYDPFDDVEPLELEVPLDPVARLTATQGPERSVPQTILAEQPSLIDPMTTTKEERNLAKETYEQSTPGSSASFQAAQAATGMSPESWFKKWGGGPSGDLSGFIPEKAMVKVGDGHYLAPAAGKNFKAMLRAARKDGINIAYTDTYRDYQTQVATKEAKGAYAATPGHSNHGWGMAVDFNVTDPKVKAWLDKNAKRFGWVNPLWAHDGEGIEEPWHWEYVGGGQRVKVKNKSPKKHRDHNHPLTDPLNKLDSMSSINSPTAVFGKLLDEIEAPAARSRKRGTSEPAAPTKGVKGQLYAGFMEAGRPDLAKMVFTKEFDTWMEAETGKDWARAFQEVSQPYEGIRNYGGFQFRNLPGRSWLTEFIKGGKFTATPYQQAILVARYFDLTPNDIRTYASQINRDEYLGWG